MASVNKPKVNIKLIILKDERVAKTVLFFFNFLGESNRVPLQYVRGVENSDYINAVFVEVRHIIPIYRSYIFTIERIA